MGPARGACCRILASSCMKGRKQAPTSVSAFMAGAQQHVEGTGLRGVLRQPSVGRWAGSRYTACVLSLLPMHNATASARLVSRLSSDGFTCFEDYIASLFAGPD